ncbi:MAG: hypothetical protein IJX08_09900 [Clostridia bacterium]|nr:hypothetical protein [Clostridia bacterium]
MIYPTLDQLSKEGKYDRYTVTIAAAKGARMVTEEYVAERERAEQMVSRKETDKSLCALIEPELRDEKAVRTAVHRMYRGEFVIGPKPEKAEGEEDACLQEGSEQPLEEQEPAAEETEA